jgi:hypothetical protein
MPRITPPALLLPAVAVLALSGGCTTSVSGAAAADSAAAGQGTVAWVDQICGSLLPYVKAAVSPPKPAEAPDPATLVRDIDNWLSVSEEGAASAISGTRIERVDIKNRQELQREVPAAVDSVRRLANSPMADLQRSPELAQAGKEAAGCQQIAREVVSNAPGQPR